MPLSAPVVVIGAGGIGFDVAAFVTDPGDDASLDIAAFQQTWGIDEAETTPGGLTSPSHRSAAREVTLLQRKTSKVGAGLGMTTGWIHRTELKARGVTMVPGVTYERIDDDGLHVTVDGAPQVLDVDTIVVVDEAVELAKELSTDDSPAFVNGVLAKIAELAPQVRAAASAEPGGAAPGRPEPN